MTRIKEDLTESVLRVEDWWNYRRSDRALLQVRGRLEQPRFVVPEIRAETLHDYWTNPDVVIPRILNELASTWYGGESFPVLYPVPGRIVSITCKYLGAPNRYLDEDTTWSEPIINDWDNPPSLNWNPENDWWILTLRNLKACADVIRNRDLECFLGHPDLNGPTEVLSGLRNPEKMCMDLLLNPENIKYAAAQVQEAWFKAWNGVREICGEFGGCFTFMGLWSELPAPDLQSDFSSLISTEMFAEFILPLVREQAGSFPRSVFHLDGPDMIRHLDLLMQVEEISAIQWVQGAGAGPVSDWIPLMKRIQEGGKSLYIYCEPWEIPVLLKKLSPTGLIMCVSEQMKMKEASDLLAMVRRLS